MSIIEFANKIKEDEKFRYEFFQSEDPSQFLNSKTGVVIPDDQKSEFNKYITEMKESYSGKTVRIRKEDGRDVFDITVEVCPPA